MSERISVAKAAQLLGTSALTIRAGIDNGDFTFGTAIHNSKHRTYYHISPKKLYEYLGLKEKANNEIDPNSVTDFKIKQLQHEVFYLKKKLNEQNTILHSILDAQEYILKNLDGKKSFSYQSLYEVAINHFRQEPTYVEAEEKITVKRAAELIGTSAITIHAGLISGEYPFGIATRQKLYDGRYKNVYHIYASKLAEYLGISVDEVKGDSKQ